MLDNRAGGITAATPSVAAGAAATTPTSATTATTAAAATTASDRRVMMDMDMNMDFGMTTVRIRLLVGGVADVFRADPPWNRKGSTGTRRRSQLPVRKLLCAAPHSTGNLCL